MMWIETMMHMSGTRANGEKYPPGWTPFEVADWEGEQLIRGGMARQVAMPDWAKPRPPKQSPPPAPERVQAAPELPVPRSEPSLTAAGPLTAEAPAETPVAAEPEPGQEQAGPAPAPSDPKQAWVDYAITRGMDADAAARMTKVDLQSRFGPRL